jgi:hypothetical protein
MPVNFMGSQLRLAGLARVVTDHATPVGSGTVARTKRIPVEQRAEAAVIAWMRHQTTGYDGMVIPRVKGKRQEVRRMLARRSHQLLERYRRGEAIPETCPLMKALMCSASTTRAVNECVAHATTSEACGHRSPLQGEIRLPARYVRNSIVKRSSQSPP